MSREEIARLRREVDRMLREADALARRMPEPAAGREAGVVVFEKTFEEEG